MKFNGIAAGQDGYVKTAHAFQSALKVTLLALATLGPECAFSEPVSPVITSHSIASGAKTLSYTAEAGRVAIRDAETGEPHGFIFYTAYRIESSGEARPVTFVWNGGPGANSTLLHFELIGPKRAEGNSLIDNPDTLLTDSDLVFVDPIGTGFSRPARAKYAEEFYGTLGDVSSITEFVRSWLLLHDVDNAPLFLIGESWGARRAASVGYALQMRGIDVNGLVLISGGAGLNSQFIPPALAEALAVADFSVTSLYHGKLAANVGSKPETVRKSAEAWARKVYAPALVEGAGNSGGKRNQVIKGLAKFTGMAVDQVDQETLRLSPARFRSGLIPEKSIDVFDMRLINEDGSGVSQYRLPAPAMLRYFRQDLGYRTSAPYVGLESLEVGYAPTGNYPAGVNTRWNYATAEVSPEEFNAAITQAVKTGRGPPRIGPPLPATEELVALNPDIRILVAAGQYDSLNSCTTNVAIAESLTWPMTQSLSIKCYTGGHMMYRDADARLQLSRDIKVLINTARGTVSSPILN